MNIDYNTDISESDSNFIHINCAVFDISNVYKVEASIKSYISNILSNNTSKEKIQRFAIHLSPELIKHKLMNYLLYCITASIFPYDETKQITITHKGSKIDKIKKELDILKKVTEARTLSMLPPNIGTPEKMASEVKHIFKDCPKTRVKVFDVKKLKKDHFNLILAVGEGSKYKPRLVIVERKVKNPKKTICLLGKGITFDSGGLALKPLNYMIDMKFDKIGAVYSIYALHELICLDELKNCNLIGIFPFAHNLISENAVIPSSVITSYSGKTVEIVNPDAEGRLILGDALGYSKIYKPDLVIDTATLTGNAATVNCFQTAYFYCTNEALKRKIETIGERIGERLNPMPSWNEYAYLLKSSVADLRNDGAGKNCDAFMAALFLKEFVPEKCDWLHLDLTTTIINNIPDGRGIKSLIEIVKEYAK